MPRCLRASSGHEIDRVLSLPLFLGAEGQGREVEFPLWQADRDAADALLGRGEAPGLGRAQDPSLQRDWGGTIGVHPGAREMTKRWAPERFVLAAAELQRRHGGTVVVVGGPDERELGAEVFEGLRSRGCSAVGLTGETTLPVLGALIERMTLLLTNDSGPAHIAYALGTPTVTVFGGTDPARWGPPDDGRFVALANPVQCWPCPHWVCPTNRECLAGISVEAVVAAAEAVLDVRETTTHRQACRRHEGTML